MKKYSKFRNVRTQGYDSKKEYYRSVQLKLLQKQGLIKGLQEQVSYPIVINGIKICSYIADFKYIENGKEIVEDCKGFLTPIYKLKKKLMEAVWGIEILET